MHFSDILWFLGKKKKKPATVCPSASCSLKQYLHIFLGFSIVETPQKEDKTDCMYISAARHDSPDKNNT